MSQLPPCSRGGTFDVALRRSSVRGCGERRVRQRLNPSEVGGDEINLALVPGVEQLLVRQASDQPRVNETGEADPRDVARTGVEAGNVPDRSKRTFNVQAEPFRF